MDMGNETVDNTFFLDKILVDSYTTARKDSGIKLLRKLS